MRNFSGSPVIAQCKSRMFMTLFGSLIAIMFFVAPSQADQVILDDLIVDGSQCIGFDCVNGESFGFDTLILKENNLRIYFNDTSNTSSFPANDWRIQINDSTDGGSNYFGIVDATAGKTVFRLLAGAPADALVVNDKGLGLGTATPATDLHIMSSDTPAMRLEQNGTYGWPPQTWDVAGNESNFFVRDVTNGNLLPFRIKPGAPTNSLYIAANGNVGFGTPTPAAQLHATGSIRFDMLSGCSSGIGVNASGDLACLPASSATLVQQAGAGQPITVGAATDGTVVDITGTDGARVLTGVASATAANDAINLDQLQSSGQRIASIVGGGSQVNADGTLSAPSYTIQGNTLNVIGDAFAALDGTVTSNSNAISDETATRSTADAALDGRVTTTEGDVTALQNAGRGMSWTSGSEPISASATGTGSIAIGSGASARTRDTAVGYMATVTADGSTALGANTLIATENSVAVGADAVVNEVGGTALGQNASVAVGATGSVAVGQNSEATEANTVSVGSASNQRRITNVADGVNANDAVTVQQMQQFATSSSVDIGRLDKRIDDVDDRIDEVGALASAFSALVPNSRTSGNTQISLGIANYSGANAMAAGLFHYVSNNVLVNVGVSSSFSSGETATRAGVTFGF